MTQRLWEYELSWLRKKLIGNSYSSFTSSDVWTFHFSNLYLLAHEFTSPVERDIRFQMSNFLTDISPVDADDVLKAAIVSSLKRKTVTYVDIDEDCLLTLEFDTKTRISFPTNTNIVDWHWCLNETGDWPHTDCIIGCFLPGQLESNRIG